MGVLVQSVVTDSSGAYRLASVPPTDGTTERYEVQFTAPGAGSNTAKLGKADSAFTNWLQRITAIAVPSGSNLQNLNLPINPNGVVYNSMTRAPIAGVRLNMLSAGSRALLPAACFDDPAQQGQITQTGGYYRFDVNFSDPGCSSGGSYLIEVTAPTSSYVAGESKTHSRHFGCGERSLLRAGVRRIRLRCTSSNTLLRSTSVGVRAASLCARGQHRDPVLPESHTRTVARCPDRPRSTTTTYLSTRNWRAQFSITKTTPLRYVTRGQLVPYTITINNVLGASMQGVRIGGQLSGRLPLRPRDPRGLDGGPAEPTLAGRQLVWNGLSASATPITARSCCYSPWAQVFGEGEFRQSRAGHRRRDRQGPVGRGNGNRSCRSGSDLRLYRRNWQSLR
jgi:hypothetical protein